jgi:hypothetical protein
MIKYRQKYLKKLSLFYISMYCVLASLSSPAQTIYINFTDGETKAYPIYNIHRTAFSSSDMILHMVNGTLVSWNLDSIRKYWFSERTVSSDDPSLQVLPLLNVYPNPSTGQTSVEFTLNQSSNVRFEIIDHAGRLIQQKNMGFLNGGNQKITWNRLDGFGNEAVAGAYLFRIITNDFSISRTFILQ